MSNYIGITSPLAVVNSYSDLDYYYGPYSSVQDALTKIISGIRAIGRTIGILTGTDIEEYWFKSGIEDSDLVPKDVNKYSATSILMDYWYPKSEYYTLSTAITTVPNILRGINKKITFISGIYTVENWEFIGEDTSTWERLSMWKRILDSDDLNSIENALSGIAGSYLGNFTYAGGLPTPIKSGYYILNNAINYSSGNISVNGNAGDYLSIVVDNGYTYSIVSMSSIYQSSLNLLSSELNIDKLYPLSASYYTLSTAIAAVVTQLRSVNAKITFKSAANTVETWVFTSTINGWSNTSNWQPFASVEQSRSQDINKSPSSKLFDDVIGSIDPQIFTGATYTNPFTVSKAPRRIGDQATNSTTLEIWQAISTTNAAASWTRISAGIYGGTLATDLNAINLSGFITILSTGLNVPNANENWYVNHINSNSGIVYAYQVAVGFTTGDKYWRTKINSVWGSWTKEEHFTTAYKNQVDTNASDIAELKLGSGYYYISGWDSSLSPTPVVSKGNQTWACDISHVNLFDMSQNTGQAIHPIGELQRANYLRYIDGTFAPTVGITESMRAACDIDLYLDSAHTNLYSVAGAFNATTFYNTYGMNQKLYDSSGNEVRILRPWETTSINYHIGQSFSEKVWVIDGIGNSGLYWQGIAQHDITWDGVKGVPLERTAISPCPSTTVGGKMRNFFFLYNAGDSNTASSAGQSGLCTIFSGMNRTFPRVNDISQISNMNFARANNSVTTNPYPVAEGGYHALNAAIIRREILFGTRYLHNPSLFGSGISSNDTCNSEATFLANGGFKYKIHTDSAWNYGTFGTTPTMCYNNSGGTTNASIWLSNYYPKEQCMESQLAASFAKETGVSPNTDFSFYGATYQYRNVTGVLGLADGRMNVIVTKVLSQTISAFNSLGVATNYDISCCLRMSLIDGMNLSGDIFRYFGGGYEQVGTCVSTVQPHTGDIIDIYLQPDQKSWLNITDVTKNNLGAFDFEKTYTKLGTTTNLGDNYVKTRMPLSAWKTSIGGSLSTGQCYYAWDNDYWSIIINQRVRTSARFGGFAYYGYCCARSMNASNTVSNTYAFYGGSAQVLVN